MMMLSSSIPITTTMVLLSYYHKVRNLNVIKIDDLVGTADLDLDILGRVASPSVQWLTLRDEKNNISGEINVVLSYRTRERERPSTASGLSGNGTSNNQRVVQGGAQSFMNEL